MACIGNMPGFKYVTVESLVITYNGTPYPIKTFVTNKKYIVWNIDRPYQLEDTNVRPESSLLEYLIVINDKGKPTIVKHEELLYSFDQTTNGSNLTSSTEYNALKTEVKDNSKKFNLISNTVDGMSQIIGTTEELKDGSIIYNLNKVKSDSKSYGISIEEIQTKVDDKYAEIKPIILNDLVEYLRSVSEYKLSFTDLLEDTLTTVEELDFINTNKTNLINKFNQLQTTLSNLKAIIDSVEDAEKSQLIVDAKTKLTTLHDVLVAMCDSYLQNSSISGEEKTNIIQKSYELATYIGTVQNTCSNITVNGQAGVVYSIENELLMLKDRTTSTIKEMSKDATDLGTKVSNQTSEISQMKDSIALKLGKKDVTDIIDSELGNYTTTIDMDASIDLKIDGILSDVSENYLNKTDAESSYASKSQIKQLSDSITSKVEVSVYNLDKETFDGRFNDISENIDNIPVGGNLIPNTDLKYGLQGWGNTDNAYSIINEDNFSNTMDLEDQISKVHFIYGYPNVQSDCQLIQTVTGKNILIDAAYDVQGDSIVDYLKKLEITRLDYVFATHAHSDHIGGMPKIIDNFDIDVFYGINPNPNILHQEEIEWQTMAYWDRVKEALARKNMDVTYPPNGIQLSKYDRLDIYNIKEPTPKMNDMSLVLKYTHMANRIVLSGDVEFTDEDRIASQIGEVDVLKVGHHGLDTSTGYTYINTLKPKMTIMTTTSNEWNGRIPVLTRLQLEGVIKNLTLGTEGTIVITSDGTKYASNVERGISIYNNWGKAYSYDYFFDWAGRPIDEFRTIYSYEFRNIDYYFKNYEMQVGWIEIPQGEGIYSKWYYAKEDTDWQYYVGELVKGWYELSWNGNPKDWYYFDLNNHEMFRNRWIKHDNGCWYYIKEHGEMAKSETLFIEDDFYTFDSEGRML